MWTIPLPRGGLGKEVEERINTHCEKLRNNCTETEKNLWYVLRAQKPGVRSFVGKRL